MSSTINLIFYEEQLKVIVYIIDEIYKRRPQYKLIYYKEKF